MGYFLQPAIHNCVVSISSGDSPFLLCLSLCLSIRKARPCHYHGLKSRPLRSWQSGAQETQTLSLPQGCPSPPSLEQPPLSSWPGALPIIPEPLMGKAELTAPWGR